MSSGNRASTIKAILTLVTISIAAVGSIVIPLAVWFHSVLKDMRGEDMLRINNQFAKIENSIEDNRKEDIFRASKLAGIEKSIEMILATRKENLDEFNKRFDKIDAALIRLEAKIK